MAAYFIITFSLVLILNELACQRSVSYKMAANNMVFFFLGGGGGGGGGAG